MRANHHGWQNTYKNTLKIEDWFLKYRQSKKQS
jgi:hypothetical protein